MRSISAVGEYYVDLRPRTDSPPYLHDGSVIAKDNTTIPQPIGPVLDQSSALINSIPKGKLGTLLDESFKAFNGAGYDFGSLFDSSAQVSGDLNSVADRARTLTEDTGLLDTQAQTTDQIHSGAQPFRSHRSLAKTTQIRTVLNGGPGPLTRHQSLLDQTADTAGAARQSHHRRSDRSDLPRLNRAGVGVAAAVHRRDPVVPARRPNG